VKVVQFVALLLFSLVTGVFWGTWFSLSRSMVSLTASTFLEVGHAMIRDRWEFYHGLRTRVSLVALSCLFVATLLPTRAEVESNHDDVFINQGQGRAGHR